LSPATAASTRLVLAFAIAASLAPCAHADTTELEVYRGDLDDQGEVNVDFEGNLLRAPLHGDLSGQAVAQALGELSYGLSDNMEVGLKLPISYSNGAWYGKSLLAELKYVAPHEKTGWYWGAEVEAGYLTSYDERLQWNAEIVPIAGYRGDCWEFTFNPDVSIASGGDQRGTVMFEPSGKVSYRVARKTSIGVEYFSEAGPLHAPLPGNQRSELAFLALDTKVGKSAINFGIGHGVNSYSPGFAAKAIVDLEFD
jgi:hypothetical protein